MACFYLLFILSQLTNQHKIMGLKILLLSLLVTASLCSIGYINVNYVGSSSYYPNEDDYKCMSYFGI